MSLATWAFPLEESQNNNSASTDVGRGTLRGTNKAKTLKNRNRASPQSPGGDQSLLQELKDSVYGDAAESRPGGAASGLGDFVPHPESVGAERRAKRDNTQQNTQQPAAAPGPAGCLSHTDEPCSAEGFDDLANTRIDDYYARAVPMYQENAVQSSERDVMLAKLNYMIHLLEEQRDERTGHVTEEIILYCFLGIFMIFMVDSFARVGKYVR